MSPTCSDSEVLAKSCLIEKIEKRTWFLCMSPTWNNNPNGKIMGKPCHKTIQIPRILRIETKVLGLFPWRTATIRTLDVYNKWSSSRFWSQMTTGCGLIMD